MAEAAEARQPVAVAAPVALVHSGIRGVCHDSMSEHRFRAGPELEDKKKIEESRIHGVFLSGGSASWAIAAASAVSKRRPSNFEHRGHPGHVRFCVASPGDFTAPVASKLWSHGNRGWQVTRLRLSPQQLLSPAALGLMLSQGFSSAASGVGNLEVVEVQLLITSGA